jgi:MSHA biogenesis protein MshJ
MAMSKNKNQGPRPEQALWQHYSARFLAMSARERLMVGAVTLVSIVYLASIMWLTPTFERAQKYSQQSTARAEELTDLDGQMKTLSEHLESDPNTALRRELDSLERQISSVEERLRPYGSAMVNPTHTVTLLKELIQKTPGVRLSGFNNLPAVGLLASQQPEAKRGEPVKIFENDVYKHGFEIKLRGNYLALLTYLRMLEAQPERLFWHRAKLEVLTYPESEVTLVVYTLSLDRHWLEL